MVSDALTIMVELLIRESDSVFSKVFVPIYVNKVCSWDKWTSLPYTVASLVFALHKVTWLLHVLQSPLGWEASPSQGYPTTFGQISLSVFYSKWFEPVGNMW